MKILKTGIINDDRMLLHKSKSKQPQSPLRVQAIMQQLENTHYLKHQNIQFIPSYQRIATAEELKLVYPQTYINYIDQLWSNSSHRTDIKILDTYFCKHSSKAAKISVAGVLQGVDHIMKGEWKNGFAIIRPPGHHSGGRNTINGFCIFNNVAIAARYLQKNYGLKKIVIFDWDIHHGDGTQHVFNQDQNILFISIHRYDRGTYYPAGEFHNYESDGLGKAKGTKVNIPLNYVNNKFVQYKFQAPGDNQYIYIYNRIIEPIIKEFKPQFILLSSGFDASRYDPLGGFTVTPNGYYYMTRKLCNLGLPVLSVLEGGYNLKETALASLSVVKGLLGEQNFPEQCQGNYNNIFDRCHLQKQYHEFIDVIIQHHSKHWQCLNKQQLKEYTQRIKQNTNKVFGVIQDQSSSSSSQQQQLKNQQTKQMQINTTELYQLKKQTQEECNSQFYFASGHMHRFKDFNLKKQNVLKEIYPQQLKFYSSDFPQKQFAPKYFGKEGQYVIIQNLLFQQEDFIVADFKMSRHSKKPGISQEKAEKQKKKQQISTSQKLSFRLSGFTTPSYKQSGLLNSDESIIKKILNKIVNKDNKNDFINFLKRMSEVMKNIKRKYFATSIIMVKGKTKSIIKWIDFHYWVDDCESYDIDLVEGIDNLCKFVEEVQITN